jgi:hypothetical protein
MGIIFANEKTIERMRNLELLSDHLLFPMPQNSAVDPRVADHTDLSLFISDAICVAPEVFWPFMDQLKMMQKAGCGDFRILKHKLNCGIQALNKEYPYNIAYNAVKLKNHFFHMLAHTEPKILESIFCKKVDVKQGYTRCGTLVLTEEAVITEDAGLAQSYKAHGYEALVIEKGHVVLPGYNYGFIGGIGGVIEDILVINGALKHHPDGDAIKAFVLHLGLRIVELHDDPLLDCGSILYLNTK